MSGAKQLIRASKQSGAIRTAIACHLQDVLKEAVDPEFLDGALEKFYETMDGIYRTGDIDLMEVEGDGLAAAEEKFVWSKKPKPLAKIMKLNVLEKQPTDGHLADNWVVKRGAVEKSTGS